MFTTNFSFGASYTQTVGAGEEFLEPTLEEPLGVPFPGTTCNEEGRWFDLF